MAAVFEVIDYMPGDRLGYGTSMLLVYGVATIVYGSIFAVLVMRAVMHYRRQKRAQAMQAGAETAHATTIGHIVLRGTVETDDPKKPAITIQIDQLGRTYQTKGGPAHEWKEIDRTVTVAPFWLVLASGERVRVLPPEDVMLVDALDKFETLSSSTRRCSARLENGETATIAGVLKDERTPQGDGSAYRGGGTTPVLRPLRSERMLISTEPLPERHGRWARFFGLTAAILGVALALAHTLAFMPFHRLNVQGVDAEAVVNTKETWQTHGKTTVTHYKVTAYSSKYDITLSDETSGAAYAKATKGLPIPFIIVPSKPSINQIGYLPGVPLWCIFMFIHPTVFGVMLFWLAYRKRRTWYEQKLVVHTGKGALPT